MKRPMIRQVYWKRPAYLVRFRLPKVSLYNGQNLSLSRQLVQTSVTPKSTLFTQNLRWLSMVEASSPAQHDEQEKKEKKKPEWMDVRRPLKTRVQEFLASNSVHLADFTCSEVEEMIRDCSKMGSLEGMEMAQDIVDRLLVEKRRVQMSHPDICVPVKFIQVLLYGWATLATKQRVAQTRMKEILQLAIDESHHDVAVLQRSAGGKPVQLQVKELRSQPTVDIFNTYLFGLRNLSKLIPQAAVDAEAVLFEMMEYNRKFSWFCKPNNRCYINVACAYANTGHKQAGQRALGLLRKMQHVHKLERESYEEEYGIQYNVRNPKANKRVVVTPDVLIYTTVIKAMIENNNSQVLNILKEAISSETVVLDEYLFSAAIKALSASIEKERNAAKRMQIAKQAEEIFSMMVASSDNIRPTETENGGDGDATAFKSRNQNAIVSGYNSVLDVWSRSYSPEGAPHCEILFQEMLDKKDVKPNVISLNSCLYAWSRSLKFHKDAAKRAEELLKRQWKLYQAGELGEDAKPDFQSYTIAILTHAESDDPDKLSHATELLYYLIDRFCEGEIRVTRGRNPNSPFTAVLSAAARSPKAKSGPRKSDEFNVTVNTKTDPYTIANHIYQQLQKNGYNMGTTVDHHAASAFLRVIANHCPRGSTERDTMSMMVFDEACQNGEVSRLVVDAMKYVLEGRTQEFSHIFDRKERPKDWSRNVPREFQ